jgi:acyl-[acyl-carrier-protein] desaturase
MELLSSLAPVVETNLQLLLPIEKAWQPSDYLPDLSIPDWQDRLVPFREASAGLSDELLVVLVGDMVTEEALPNYAVHLNLIARDETGVGPDPWSKWLRGWTGEENRHGDLLNAFLRLTGRVDMRAVEVTVHHLIVNGFSPRAHPDLYAGLIYTAFQERATKISHGRVGRLASEHGDQNLAKICGKIAGDESRHEEFYTRMMGEVFERDPGQAALIFRKMLRRVIAMPGRLMYDGMDPDLFDHFSAVALRLGVYTAYDYAQIVEHLVERWKIATLSLSGPAAAAQEYLCGLTERLGSAADAIQEKANASPPARFSWIRGREA